MYTINNEDSYALVRTNKTLSTKLHPSPLFHGFKWMIMYNIIQIYGVTNKS